MKTKCCSTCKNKQIRTTDEPCNTCITEYSYNGVLPSYTPRMTNADRIRAMTDEELAVFISDQIIDRNIGIPSETWLDWLKQEAKE